MVGGPRSPPSCPALPPCCGRCVPTRPASCWSPARGARSPTRSTATTGWTAHLSILWLLRATDALVGPFAHRVVAAIGCALLVLAAAAASSTTDHPELTAVGYGQGANVNDRGDDPQPWIESVRRRTTVEATWVDATDVKTSWPGSHPSTGCAGNSGGGLFRPGHRRPDGTHVGQQPDVLGLCPRHPSRHGRCARLPGRVRRGALTGDPYGPSLNRPGRRGVRGGSAPTPRR